MSPTSNLATRIAEYAKQRAAATQGAWCIIEDFITHVSVLNKPAFRANPQSGKNGWIDTNSIANAAFIASAPRMATDIEQLAALVDILVMALNQARGDFDTAACCPMPHASGRCEDALTSAAALGFGMKENG